MLKTLAVVRTVFLIFILGYSLRVVPWGWSQTFDEEFARCTATRSIAIKAAWLAIAWIALDTLLSWWLANRASRTLARPADVPKPGEPPFAPPGR